MKYSIDIDKKILHCEEGKSSKELPLYSKESFDIISDIWLKVGWNEKYPYTFSWMGRPIIQIPEDMVRAQEALYRLKPDVIVDRNRPWRVTCLFCKYM